jgi:hypothetical protein
MGKYNFAVRQHAEGYWEAFDTKDGFVIGADYETGEQAEREAQQFTDYMNQREEIADQIKKRMVPMIAAWADEIVSEHGLDRSEVLLNIRNGIDLALDYLACPTG